MIEINGEIKTIQHHINELTKSKTEFMTENNNLKSQINGKYNKENINLYKLCSYNLLKVELTSRIKIKMTKNVLFKVFKKIDLLKFEDLKKHATQYLM